jgi:ribosomal protein S21
MTNQQFRQALRKLKKDLNYEILPAINRKRHCPKKSNVSRYKKYKAARRRRRYENRSRV